jgi:hypothetical protein
LCVVSVRANEITTLLLKSYCHLSVSLLCGFLGIVRFPVFRFPADHFTESTELRFPESYSPESSNVASGRWGFGVMVHGEMVHGEMKYGDRGETITVKMIDTGQRFKNKYKKNQFST